MSAEELKEKGNQLFKSGEYQTAIRYYTEAIVTLFLIVPILVFCLLGNVSNFVEAGLHQLCVLLK